MQSMELQPVIQDVFSAAVIQAASASDENDRSIASTSVVAALNLNSLLVYLDKGETDKAKELTDSILKDEDLAHTLIAVATACLLNAQRAINTLGSTLREVTGSPEQAEAAILNHGAKGTSPKGGS